jgi:hypothetical protein
MLNVRKDATNIYVFTGIMPALILVILTVVGNNMAISEAPERIVSEAAYTVLILVAAQARSSFIDFIAA